MRILLCSTAPLVKEFGAAKPILELAEELECLGWDCDKIDPHHFFSPEVSFPEALNAYAANLRKYLQQRAGEYDVVDYDHEYLPYPRQEFSATTLMVARSVLLAHHLETIRIPVGKDLRGRVGALIKGRARQRESLLRVSRAQETVRQADLINVSNHEDEQELRRRGIEADKIVVLPFGISRSRRVLFNHISTTTPARPIIVFVGTFNYRKGANEFPCIVEQVVKAVPEARFRLLGTAGMFKTEEEVMAHFPPRLREYIEVVPRYRHEELPELLAECTVGVFPSYVEGFPFGVLEMLAAALPVVAFRSPGPPMMLSDEFLVPCGDAMEMGRKVTALLKDSQRLAAAREWAQQRSRQFSWQQIAVETDRIYRTRQVNR